MDVKWQNRSPEFRICRWGCSPSATRYHRSGGMTVDFGLRTGNRELRARKQELPVQTSFGRWAGVGHFRRAPELASR